MALGDREARQGLTLGRWLALLLIATVALPVAGPGSRQAGAQTVAQGGTVSPAGGLLYFVNTTSDNIVVGACETGGPGCSLRAAIGAANNNQGDDEIEIAIPPSDPGCFGGQCIINLTGALPDLSTNMVITGPGPSMLTVRRALGGNYRIFTVTTPGAVSLSGLTIANGSVIALEGGGGVYSLTGATVNITNSVISGNSGGIGGGIWNQSGTLNVTNSTISGNSGGGIANTASGTGTVTNSVIDDNQDGTGLVSIQGIVTIRGSTFSRNRSSFGGGLSIIGGVADIMNSTIGNNTASNAGGAIWVEASAAVNLTNSTVINNLSGNGGGIYTEFSTATVKNSIMALNTANSNPDVFGSFTSSGFNLIGKADGSTGFTAPTDQTGTVASPLDPMLDPSGLQNNGGTTPTVALLCGSPAIDKATSNSLLGNLTTDQRGLPRTHNDSGVANAVGGDGTDIGAFELQQNCVPPTPTATLTSTTTATRTATMTSTGTRTPTATHTMSLTSTPGQTSAVTQTPTETATPLITNTATSSATLVASASPTPTGTATAIATSTSVLSATLTATPTAPITSTTQPSPGMATPTATPSGLGGAGFAMQLEGPAAPGGAVGGRATGDRLFSWEPGTQARSLLVRWSQARGFVFLPALAAPLGPGVGSYRDSSPLAEPIYCYVLVSFIGEVSNPAASGLSDLLCVIPESGSANRPRDFTVRLNQSSDAELSWSGPGGQSAYSLVTRQLNGSPLPIPLPGGQTSTTLPVGAGATCFQVYAFAGAQIMGYTDGLCVIPGIASAGIWGVGRP